MTIKKPVEVYQNNTASPPNQVVLGLIQMQCGNDSEENMSRCIAHIRTAASQGAQVICLQELSCSPYFCQEEDVRFFDSAESVPGPTTEILGEIAHELQVLIVASLFEKRTSGIYHNCAVIIDMAGKVVSKYRKMHIPDDPYYHEKFYFTPGDLGFQSHSTPYGTLGVLVCWDQWFPEAARLTALQGAQIILYPTAIGFLEGVSKTENKTQHSAWETVQRSHAITNGVFVAAVNRVGQEGNLTFWGQSFVCDPFGNILAKASAEDEEILVVKCNLERIEKIRRDWPFWRDRRIEAYQGLDLRFVDEVSDDE
ncbi:MAG: carbon-nitrogen hydrolase [Acidobacteriota bacterium]|nr:carbon-nitrogen hydrolase [Acidobacteriota bacterium]